MKTTLSMFMQVSDREEAMLMVDGIQAFLRTTHNRGLSSYGFANDDVHPKPKYALYDDNDDGDH